jgi:hypothetical protein
MGENRKRKGVAVSGVGRQSAGLARPAEQRRSALLRAPGALAALEEEASGCGLTTHAVGRAVAGPWWAGCRLD